MMDNLKSSAESPAFTGEDLDSSSIGEVLSSYSAVIRPDVIHGLMLVDRIFDHSSDGVVVMDPVGRTTKVNRSFLRITGFSQEESLGQFPEALFITRYGTDFQLIWNEVDLHDYWSGEILGHRKTGERYVLRATISALRDRNDALMNYIIVFSDITAHKDSEQRIDYLTNHDALTGLPNRSLLFECIETAMEEADAGGKPVFLLQVNVDRFKSINDSYGAAIGDEVLCQIASRLKSCAAGDVTVARVSGDEFVLLGRAPSPALAGLELSEKIMQAMTRPYVVGDNLVSISVSQGACIYPGDGSSAEALVGCANMAVRHAKDLGRNQCQLYRTEMNSSLLRRMHIEHGLKSALSSGELQLYYQPQVDVRTGLMVGAEALIRWTHPELGVIQPGDFIQIAEESELIVNIGEWAIIEACRQMALWRKMRYPRVPVAVNVSPFQFRHQRIEDVVASALRNTGLPAEYLEIEITESVMMHDADEIIERMRKIRRSGVRISIDDFGTGYSSLSYLKRFSIDKIKLDRSFISDTEMDEGGTAVISAIIGLARSLNLKVLAEGVENESQAEYLRRLGCDEFQGYYFSRPLTADGMTDILEDMHRLTSE